MLAQAKLYGWYFLHDRRKFNSDLLKRLHLLTLRKSQYYPECIEFYSQMDVEGKVVLDMGDDFGSTAMFFVGRGARHVTGISLEPAYFHDPKYEHIVGPLSFDEIEKLRSKRTFDVLKSDVEGFEWNYTIPFVDSFEQWIIALHSPIRNFKLYEHIKHSGEYIGRQDGKEFAVYRRKK